MVLINAVVTVATGSYQDIFWLKLVTNSSLLTPVKLTSTCANLSNHLFTREIWASIPEYSIQ